MAKAPPGASASVSAPTSTAASLATVARLEKQASGSSDLNALVDLLNLLQTASNKSKVRCSAANALHNVFSTLIRQGRLIGKVKETQASSQSLEAVRSWAKARWTEYTDTLCALLAGSDEMLATASLNMLMSLLRTTSEHLSRLQTPPQYYFDVTLWRRIVAGLLLMAGTPTIAVRAEFVNRYLNYNDDVRFYFLRVASEHAHTARHNAVFRANLLYYLEALTTMPTAPSDINAFWAGEPGNKTGKVVRPNAAKSVGKKRKRSQADVGDGSTGMFDDSDESDDDDITATRKAGTEPKRVGQHELFSLEMHRRVFSEAWTAFLGSSMSEDDIKRVLVMLHRQIMPHLVDPSILIDFLADCCDYGGTLALLALNGLFTLITKHRLDYPNFFLNLYRLVDAQVLHVRYRPRFMRMLDTFLTSTHLPAALVAAFIKRLVRLCLRAPPAATVSVIPFIYNLLKRHPSCMPLIHSAEQPEPGTVYQDPYVADEPDPLKSGALESSLWEVASLRTHYIPSVSTMAKIFEEAFTKPNYNMEDFLDHAYSTMFATETARTIKKPPAQNRPLSKADLAYVYPRTASAEGGEDQELAMQGKGDIITQLWRF